MRREGDLDQYRERERSRQARWRAAKDAGSGGVASSQADPSLSQAGLGADPSTGKPIHVKRWDTLRGLSQAGLVADLARLQADLALIVGQVEHG